jgi:hypothetical protein
MKSPRTNEEEARQGMLSFATSSQKEIVIHPTKSFTHSHKTKTAFPTYIHKDMYLLLIMPESLPLVVASSGYPFPLWVLPPF